MWGQKYRERYWKKELFETVERLKDVCEKHNTNVADAAHRWMVHHSALVGSQGDKVSPRKISKIFLRRLHRSLSIVFVDGLLETRLSPAPFFLTDYYRRLLVGAGKNEHCRLQNGPVARGNACHLQ